MVLVKICSVSECGRQARTRGFCLRHYERWLRHGDPLLGNAAHGSARRWVLEHVNHQDEECLIWPFGRTGTGYALVRINGGKSMQVASRAMCELAHGPPPESWYEAAHTCGSGASGCVNPRHLRWATPSENRADKNGHGTNKRGSKHYNAKLTEDQVRDIRAMKGRVVQSSLAKKYGVSPPLISRIQSGVEWSWLE